MENSCLLVMSALRASTIYTVRLVFGRVEFLGRGGAYLELDVLSKYFRAVYRQTAWLSIMEPAPADMPRVLYLHDIDTGPSGSKQRLIQRAVGRERFLAPDLNTRRMLYFSTVVYIVICLVLILLTVVFFVFVHSVVAWIWAGVAAITSVVLYIYGGKYVSKLLLDTAVRRATEAFEVFRPQVIAAASFGAIVALHMDVPKMPLLLLTPAQRPYKRFIPKEDHMSLRHHPYTLIVHGSRDQSTTLEDSIRLVETSELGRCRLEVVDDDHRLRSLTQQEISAWVEEVYKRGRVNVRALAEGGDKFVDLSYFDDFGRQNSSSAEEDEDEEEEEEQEEEEEYDLEGKPLTGSLGSPRTTATLDEKSDGGHRERLPTIDSLHSHDIIDTNTA